MTTPYVTPGGKAMIYAYSKAAFVDLVYRRRQKEQTKSPMKGSFQ